MLKYINNNNCKNDNPNEFDLPKCTKSLLDNIKDNTNFLVRSKCIFMTFKEYSDKIHINKNIYSRVWESVNEKEIKNTIRIELENIKNNLLRPSTLSIPLPIYAMMAKKLEENVLKTNYVFKGNYELILYIPNLYNYNGNEREYTLFPSLDAFSKQNRWMELMTSKYSKYLQIIKIGLLKEKEKSIVKKNYFRNDLTNTCLNLGCVSNIKDSVYIPEYSKDDRSLTISAEGVPYFPKSCLRTPYYNKHMMNFKQEDTKFNSRNPNIFTDSANIITHCSAENVKEDLKDGIDAYICDTIIKKKLCEKDKDGSYSSKPLAQEVCNKETDKGRAESLLANFYKENLNPDDTKFNSRNPNIFTDSANIITHCSAENVKDDLKDGFDKYLCDTIIKEKLCEKDTDGSYSSKFLAQEVCNKKTDKGRAESLLANFYREHLNAGTKDNEYSEDYSINILKELAFRKSKFPGPNDVQEIVFSIFLIDTQFFDENLFCYMPWGNKLLIQDYVLNEGESLEVDRVSFKSFNDVYEIKFQPDGYLYLYENKKIKMLIPNQSGNLKCFTRKVLKFENMTLNIYGYDTHNNYDLRGYVKLNIKSMYTAPASIILSNSGEIIIYDLGINNRTN
jgi:hypothetical protein